MKIVVSGGHGINTAGKRTPDGMREWEFNGVVASYVMDELMTYVGVEVLRVDDITGKEDVPLRVRTSVANDWGANVYVSIHANAMGTGGWNVNAHGIETFTYPVASRESFVVAKIVQDELVRATKLTDRGIKTANLHELRETNMPAFLVECGFMTNKEEARLLKSDSYRKTCAGAIVKGLVTMYGLKKNAVIAKEDKPSDWAKEHWDKAVSLGVFNGKNPKEPLTREQAATILNRLGLLRETNK